jgi:predicted TIM-barrel fold metal-dependent hydrolase
MPRVDTHAHVFHRGLTAIATARYVPAYDATLADYLAFLDAQGIARGVLVQPSFLGSDNSHLVEALRLAAGRLAGVAVVEDALPSDKMAHLAEAGIRGLRFNLVGRSPALVAEAGHRATLEAAARLGLHVELHADAPELLRAIALLPGFDGPIVVDHFGRPSTASGELEGILALADDPRIHVKLSAPYRVQRPDATSLAPLFVAAFGPERLLWGSDWPWTQFEDRVTANTILPAAVGLTPAVAGALDATAMRLFFPGAAQPAKG